MKKKTEKLPVFLIYIRKQEDDIIYLPEEYNSREDALEDFPRIKLEYNLNSDKKIGIKKMVF